MRRQMKTGDTVLVIDRSHFLYGTRGKAIAVTPDKATVSLERRGILYSSPVKTSPPPSCGK
jgi:hypothetical protein